MHVLRGCQLSGALGLAPPGEGRAWPAHILLPPGPGRGAERKGRSASDADSRHPPLALPGSGFLVYRKGLS